MLKLDRLTSPTTVTEIVPTTNGSEFNKIINNVVAYIISDGFMGHDTIIGYVYINENNKLRREWCWWL